MGAIYNRPQSNMGCNTIEHARARILMRNNNQIGQSQIDFHCASKAKDEDYQCTQYRCVNAAQTIYTCKKLRKIKPIRQLLSHDATAFLAVYTLSTQGKKKDFHQGVSRWGGIKSWAVEEWA